MSDRPGCLFGCMVDHTGYMSTVTLSSNGSLCASGGKMKDSSSCTRHALHVGTLWRIAHVHITLGVSACVHLSESQIIMCFSSMSCEQGSCPLHMHSTACMKHSMRSGQLLITYALHPWHHRQAFLGLFLMALGCRLVPTVNAVEDHRQQIAQTAGGDKSTAICLMPDTFVMLPNTFVILQPCSRHQFAHAPAQLQHTAGPRQPV